MASCQLRSWAWALRGRSCLLLRPRPGRRRRSRGSTRRARSSRPRTSRTMGARGRRRRLTKVVRGVAAAGVV